jgi:hypothetical protein
MSADAVVLLKGVIFAGARGVGRVELSFDDGQSWQDARIDYRGAPLAWIFWSYPWTARQPGTYKLVVRATDATGMLQTATEHYSDPEGATVYHRITARVEA